MSEMSEPSLKPPEGVEPILVQGPEVVNDTSIADRLGEYGFRFLAERGPDGDYTDRIVRL